MKDLQTSEQQTHPLYSSDRDHIDRLLAKITPDDSDLVDLARLMIRYEGFPGAIDLQEDMIKILNLWGLDKENLYKRTKNLWKNGFCPGNNGNSVVGSGFDTSDSQSK